MKRLTRRFLTLLLACCLLTAFCGCETAPVREVSATAAPTEPRCPEQTAASLEVDGRAAGPLCDLGGVPYAALSTLRAALPLTVTETDDSLRLELAGTVRTLRDGLAEAETPEGSRIALEAAALRCPDGWYLPAAALEALWGRTLVWDRTENVLRCLHIEPGPAIRWNGAEAAAACRCNGVLVLRASELAAACGGKLETTASPAGEPVLLLRAGDRQLSFRAGSLRREDQPETLLPVPAWQAGEDWYLPMETAVEALDCTVFEQPDHLALWCSADGPEGWFAGRCLGRTRLIGELPCGALSALAEAAGGALSVSGDTLTVHALDHVLVLHPLETRAEADGAALELPIPVLPWGDTWLAPLAPIAEALELTDRTGSAGPVYSRVETCDTLLWLDGVQTQAYTLPEGGLYVRVGDLLAVTGGCLVPFGNEASLLVRDKEVDLRGGAAECVVAGEETSLSAPVVADGADWYIPAPELLPAVGLDELVDPELDRRYYTHIPKSDEIPAGYRVPILMYHAVDDHIFGIPELFVSPSMMEAQIQAMLDAGYTAVTFEDLDRIDQIDKPVMLTFDDGYEDNYTELFPLLKKYQVKATIFVIVDSIGTIHKLTEEQIREMSDSGLVSIQSHTMSHSFLDELDGWQLIHENYDSMLALTRLTGKQPFVMCYPTGKNTAFSRWYTAQYYEYGLNMGGNCYVTGDAPFRIYRSYIARDTDVETFLKKLEED